MRDRYLVHTPFVIKDVTQEPGVTLILSPEAADRLSGYITRIADTAFECYCGHTQFRTGIDGLRICARCQVPESSIIRRRIRLGVDWNK